MPTIDPRLIIVFVWIVGCAGVTFWLLMRRPLNLPPIGISLVVALFVRFFPALVLPRGAQYEMEVFRRIGQITLDGQSVYLTRTSNPYLPFQLYWSAAAYWLTGHTNLAFPFWLKVPNIAADMIMVGLVYLAIRRQRTEAEARFGSWVFALNPITTLVVAYQGQFDAVPLLLVLASWYWIELYPNRRRGLVLSSFGLGLGILSKTWPVMFLPITLLRLPDWKWRRQLGKTAEFTLDAIDGTSVSIERFIVPSAINPLVWNLARKTFPLVNGQDGVVILGYIPVLLALFELLRGWRADVHHKVSLVLLIIGFILMLGTTLHFWGKPILLPLSSAVADKLKHIASIIGAPTIVSHQSMRIPAPGLLLRWLIPPFRSFHAFSRWGLVASLGLSTLAGLGLTRITDGLRIGPRLTVGGLALLVLAIEFNTQPLPAVTSTALMHRTVDDWLAGRPEQSVIIEYPLSYAMKPQSLYYTIAHRQKIVHGSTWPLPADYEKILTVLNQWPEPNTINLLKRIGVKYVLVDAFIGDDFEQKQLPVLMSIPSLKLIDRFPTPIGSVRDVYLFDLLP